MREIRARWAAALAVALAIAACRGPGNEGALDAGVRTQEPPWLGLTLDLTPDPTHGEVGVAVRISGDRAAAVSEIAVARTWADTRGAESIAGVSVRDGEGEVPLRAHPDDGGPDDVFGLARAPRGGDFVLRYRARANVGRSRLALRVARDRLSGVGHAFLLLPRVEAPLPVRVRIHPEALPRGADAASSFGVGTESVTTATSEDLAHAVYVAGMLWREGGDGDGDARLLVLGDPPFDTRTAFDHAVAASAAVDRFFGRVPTAPEPFTFVLVAQPGLGGGREGAYLTRSLGVWFDARQQLDSALDLVIVHELVHRFLGGSLRLVGRGGREAAWFSEGFTVHFARRALLDAGLLAPAALVADVNRTLGEGAASEERLPAEYRRGALYAAWFDAAVRHATRGRRSLDDVIRELFAAARAGGKPTLPVAALRDALAHEIGPEGAAGVDRLEARDDTPIDLPDDAFGPCAHRSVRESTAFEVGFDRRSLDGKPALIRGVVKGSAADRAGVREGMLVLSARLPAEVDALGQSPAEVELLLADGKRVRYAPVGKKRETTWEVADCPATNHSSR